MLKIYNTSSRKIEEFKPLHGNTVSMYSCGPTVYDYQHIGHMRRYVGDDILFRVLRLNGYDVKHAMNITDVGHLVSDSDTGEDKMEKGAKKFGKSVWDIAKMFESQFKDSCKTLGITLPKNLMHATDYIKEQIALIQVLEQKVYTYRIEDGIYFDSSKFPDYFKLSRQNLNELKKGSRVDFVEGKKNVSDFALWKFSYPLSPPEQVLPKGGRMDSFKADRGVKKRQMEWDSPWGIGFPGWHIECSAMSLKALTNFKFPPVQVNPEQSPPERRPNGLLQSGQENTESFKADREYTLDIHTGGIDHINIHHTNEIAQSEAATGKQFVKYWVHHNFLQVEGRKMSKSLGNFYTVQDVIAKGFDPIALRYLYLQTHYRQEMNFTWDALAAAQTAYKKLVANVGEFSSDGGRTPCLPAGRKRGLLRGGREMYDGFLSALNDDLNTPKALAVLWEALKSHTSSDEKMTLLSIADDALGLNLFAHKQSAISNKRIPREIMDLVNDRETFRQNRDFAASDEIRKKIYDLGFTISDTAQGPKVSKFDK